MTRVNLYTVEACSLGLQRSAGEPLGQGLDLLNRHGGTAKAFQIQRRRTFGFADGPMRQRACLAELGPQMGSVDKRAAGERPQSLRVAACVQNQIAWPLQKAGVDLHLANHRQRDAALRPPFVLPGLCLGRVAPAIAERVRHR